MSLIGALDALDTHHIHVRELFRLWREQHAETLISLVNLSELLVTRCS